MMQRLKHHIVLLCLCCLVACSGETDNTSHGQSAPALAENPERSIHILVIGGTNGVGRAIVQLALERGHEVTALARRPERLQFSHPQLSVTRGDILNKQDMLTAVAGHTAVVIAVGIAPTRDKVTVFSQGTENVLQAMAAHNVSRLVAISGIGAGDSRGHGGFFYDHILLPLALQTNYEDKERMEEAIRLAGERHELEWTIVRPGFLTDDSARHKYRVITDLQGITAGDISRSDVAHFVTAILESASYIGTSPLLTE